MKLALFPIGPDPHPFTISKLFQIVIQVRHPLSFSAVFIIFSAFLAGFPYSFLNEVLLHTC